MPRKFTVTGPKADIPRVKFALTGPPKTRKNGIQQRVNVIVERLRKKRMGGTK